MKLKLFVSASILMMMGLSPTVWAQDSSTLNTVVVTASRAEEKKREVTTNITVIDSKIIESSSAKTLDDLLNQQGFKVTKNPGTLSTVMIRGFQTDAHGNDLGSHVLILLDGRRLGTGNAAMIGLSNVEKVEIIRGPAAVQYGAAAMGGVVNVITKKGVGPPFKASLEAGGGSFDSWMTEAKLSGGAGQFDFAGGFNYTESGNYETGDGQVYNNTDYQNYAFNTNLGYSFGPDDKHRLGLDVNYFDSPDSGSPGTFKANGQQGASRTDKENYSTGLTYVGATSDDSLSWMARYSFGQDDRKYLYANPADNSQFKLDSQTGQAQLTYDQDMVTLTGGVDYLSYKLRNSKKAAASKSFDYRDTAVFAIGKLRFLDDSLILSAGGRYDFFDLSANDYNRTTRENHFSPSVGLAYLPLDWLKFRANYAQAFAMPTETQLGADFTYFGTHYIGNADLKPETSDTYEIGFDISGNHADFSATYFWTKTHDFIQGVNNRVTREYRYFNMDKAYRSGAELALSFDIGGLVGREYELRPYLNFNYMTKYESRLNANSIYTNIIGVPEYVAAYGLRFNHPGLDFGADLSISRYGSEYVMVQTVARPEGVQRTPYSVASLSLRKGVCDFADSGKISVKLSVDNAFNEQYSYSTSDYYMPGRSVYLGLIGEY